LPPRMTTLQINTINSPSEGLMVYCTDCTPKSLYFNNGVNFISVLDSSTLPVSPPPVVSVGDYAHGGIVVWVDPTDNTHGLVIALTDQAVDIKWNLYSSVDITGANATSFGSGASNTNAIYNEYGPGSYAVGVVKSYNGGGYSDWFLPNKDELNYIYSNKSSINTNLLANGGTTLSNGPYWCSTNSGVLYAWMQSFYDGAQYNHYFKSDVFDVRAVRAY